MRCQHRCGQSPEGFASIFRPPETPSCHEVEILRFPGARAQIEDGAVESRAHVALVANPNPVAAQDGSLKFPVASPPASVRDQIGLTNVEIQYGRPGVKGRTIFGDLIPYGANAATRITFDTAVTFGG